jgi:hypothetical protein
MAFQIVNLGVSRSNLNLDADGVPSSDLAQELEPAHSAPIVLPGTSDERFWRLPPLISAESSLSQTSSSAHSENENTTSTSTVQSANRARAK